MPQLLSTYVCRKPEMRAPLWLAIASLGSAQEMPEDRVIRSDAPIRALSFSRDGSFITGVCADRRVRSWDARTGELQRTLPFEMPEIERVTLADGADLLASASHNGSIQLWDLRTARSVRKFSGPMPRVREFVFSCDRKLLLVVAMMETLPAKMRCDWDASGVEQRVLPAGLGGISAMASAPDGTTVMAASYDTNLRVWSTRNGELLRMMDDLPLATFAGGFFARREVPGDGRRRPDRISLGHQELEDCAQAVRPSRNDLHPGLLTR